MRKKLVGYPIIFETQYEGIQTYHLTNLSMHIFKKNSLSP